MCPYFGGGPPWPGPSSSFDGIKSTTGGGNTGPVVCAKRRSRQSGAVIKIRDRIIGPTVTNRDRLQHLWTRNDHYVADNACVGPNEPAIFSCDRKSFGRSIVARF